MGAPKRVRFPARGDGGAPGGTVAEFDTGRGPARAAVSVKSGQELKKGQAPASFVEDCWSQSLQPGATRFDPTRDRLVLATLVAPATTEQAINLALQRAS